MTSIPTFLLLACYLILLLFLIIVIMYLNSKGNLARKALASLRRKNSSNNSDYQLIYPSGPIKWNTLSNASETVDMSVSAPQEEESQLSPTSYFGSIRNNLMGKLSQSSQSQQPHWYINSSLISNPTVMTRTTFIPLRLAMKKSPTRYLPSQHGNRFKRKRKITSKTSS